MGLIRSDDVGVLKKREEESVIVLYLYLNATPQKFTCLPGKTIGVTRASEDYAREISLGRNPFNAS